MDPTRIPSLRRFSCIPCVLDKKKVECSTPELILFCLGWNLDTVRAFESLGLIGILMTLVFSVVGVVHDNGGTWKVMSLISAFASGKDNVT